MSTISSLSILVPLLIGIIYFGRLKALQKCFVGFIVLSTLFEIATSYLARHGMANIWLFKIFLSFDFFFFVWFFSRHEKYPVWKKTLIGLIILTLAVSEIFFKNKISFVTNGSMFFVIMFLFFILQSSFMIVAVFDDFEIDIRKNYIFWIAFARLFYYLIIVFIYIYPGFLENGSKVKLYNITNTAINAFANVLLNLIYGVSLLCHKRKI